MESFCWLVTPPTDSQSEKTRENSVDSGEKPRRFGQFVCKIRSSTFYLTS